MLSLKEILIKVRTGGLDDKDKTGLEPWDELTPDEATTQLKALIIAQAPKIHSENFSGHIKQGYLMAIQDYIKAIEKL